MRINYERVFTVMFLACLLALMMLFALNWSTAHSNEQHTVNLPVIFNNGLPTPAPTMPVETPMPFPTPRPTPTETP